MFTVLAIEKNGKYKKDGNSIMKIDLQKKIRIIVMISVLLSLLPGIQAGEKDLPGQGENSYMLVENNVIHVENHIVAYRTSSDVLDTDHEGEYIAICDLDYKENLYLPDIFDEIYGIEIDDNNGIRVIYDVTEIGRRSVYFPVVFPSQADATVYDVQKGYTKDKVLTEVKGAELRAIPKQIWEESIAWKDQTYKVTFQRISSAYKSLIWSEGGPRADYCLTVENEEGNTVFRQTIINYPIAYEKVYWLTDFSGDEFPDIAFCTNHYAERVSWTSLHFMIWNTEAEMYEPKPLPVSSIEFPLWNEERSLVICFNNQTEEVTLDMFAFHNGDWELTGQLPADDASRFDEKSFWSIYNAENEIMYPESLGGWNWVETKVGKDTVRRYVKREALIRGENSFINAGKQPLNHKSNKDCFSVITVWKVNDS